MDNQLLETMPKRTFAPGETLIRQGQAPEAVYFLLSGCVVVLIDDETEVARVDKQGAVFGESSALLGEPANATVRAVEPTTCAVVTDLARLGVRCGPDTSVALLHHIARTLALRVHTMNKVISKNKGIVVEDELLDVLCRANFDMV